MHSIRTWSCYGTALAMLALLTVPASGQNCAPIVGAGGDITSTACAPDLCVDDCRSPGYWVSADVLSWTPHTRGLDFAVTEDGTALSLGTGQVHSLNFDRNAGIRAELGFVTKVGWGVGVGYTNFDTDGRSVVNRPPGIGQLFATASFPGGVEEADTATSQGEFKYDVFDVAALYPLVDERYIGVDLFGGLRWARIEQDVTTLYDGRDYVNGVLQDELDVDAFGVRFGSQAHWRMARGFSMFGRGAIGVLYGHIDKYRLETNLNGAQTLVDISDSYGQAVTNIEASVGLAWDHGLFRLSGGYELSNWANIGDRFRFIDDVEDGGLAPISSDILLEGFFFRVAAAW